VARIAAANHVHHAAPTHDLATLAYPLDAGSNFHDKHTLAGCWYGAKRISISIVGRKLQAPPSKKIWVWPNFCHDHPKLHNYTHHSEGYFGVEIAHSAMPRSGKTAISGDWSVFRREDASCRKNAWPKTWTCPLRVRTLQSPGTGPFFGEKTLSAEKRLTENMDLSPSRQDSALLLSHAKRTLLLLVELQRFGRGKQRIVLRLRKADDQQLLFELAVVLGKEVVPKTARPV
jgi:hypothetical protein